MDATDVGKQLGMLFDVEAGRQQAMDRAAVGQARKVAGGLTLGACPSTSAHAQGRARSRSA